LLLDELLAELGELIGELLVYFGEVLWGGDGRELRFRGALSWVGVAHVLGFVRLGVTLAAVGEVFAVGELGHFLRNAEDSLLEFVDSIRHTNPQILQIPL
jgi:hypothetical protein